WSSDVCSSDLLLHFQALTLWRDIVQAARRLALAQDMAGRYLEKRSRPDHVANHVNRAAARRRKRMARIVGAGPRACGGIVVLNMIDDMHACRCAAEEFQ